MWQSSVNMDSLQAKQVRLEQAMPVIKECLEKGCSVRFSPRGTSMLPMLRQGVDSVVLSPLPEQLRKYDLPLYQRENGQYVLHRIVRVGDTYTCVGDNQFELETGLRHAQMIAVVTGFTRDKREHSVEEVGYWLYCRLWHYSRPWRKLWRRGIGWIRRHFS